MIKDRMRGFAAAGYEGKGLMWQGPYSGEGHTREGAKRTFASHAGERTSAHNSSEARAKALRRRCAPGEAGRAARQVVAGAPLARNQARRRDGKYYSSCQYVQKSHLERP